MDDEYRWWVSLGFEGSENSVFRDVPENGN
jgi:hypothetical protein